MSAMLFNLQRALIRIPQLFSQQCTAVARLRHDIEDGEYCCGQFLGPGAERIPQRGIHGLASSIRVLSVADEVEHIKIVDGLVTSAEKYISEYPGKLKTAKLAELLFALKKVKTAPAVHAPIKKLSDLLMDAKQKNGNFGWPLLIDRSQPKAVETHLLATIFAYQALWDSGNTARTNDTLQHIEEQVESYFRRNQRERDVELYTIIFALYVITFQNIELSRLKEDTYKSYLKKVQRAIGHTLREDSEQNIEYWDSDRSYYLRIPWQLYLFALIARFRTYQLYQSFYRNRLTNLCSKFADGHFIYPYAGRLLSSRTHAIAYECLGQIQGRLTNLSLKDQVWFSLKGWLLSKIGRGILAVSAFALISVYYVEGIRSAGLDLANLAAELNGALVSFVLLWCFSVFGFIKRSSN